MLRRSLFLMVMVGTLAAVGSADDSQQVEKADRVTKSESETAAQQEKLVALSSTSAPELNALVEVEEGTEAAQFDGLPSILGGDVESELEMLGYRRPRPCWCCSVCCCITSGPVVKN